MDSRSQRLLTVFEGKHSQNSIKIFLECLAFKKKTSEVIWNLNIEKNIAIFSALWLMVWHTRVCLFWLQNTNEVLNVFSSHKLEHITWKKKAKEMMKNMKAIRYKHFITKLLYLKYRFKLIRLCLFTLLHVGKVKYLNTCG